MPEQEQYALVRMAMRAWRWLSPDTWRHTVARLVAVALLVAAGGFAFITLGLTPIAANDGHWPITQRFLKYAMTRTVRMQSLGTEVPPLDDPALVLKGAGHYATDCMPCHSAPGQTRAMVVEQMTPAPPYLTNILEDWEPQQLHWIVKHGIKYTAMPAWSSQLRDDEVWAMVAFLRRLPGMDAAQYRALAYGPLAASPAGAEGARLSTMELPPLSTVDNCARCHGAEGEGRGDGAIPRLAGQREGYLLASLQAYARGERHSGIMQPVAAGLDAPQMQGLARHYASLSLPLEVPVNASITASAASTTGSTAGFVGDNKASASIPAPFGAASSPTPAAPLSPDGARTRGATLAAQGSGDQRIPACRHCHGPGAMQLNPVYPRLAGLQPRYLALQLRLFQQDRRGGTRYRHLMRRAASALSEQQIEDLAAYYGSLDAGAETR
jgi:cytochrome c553